MEKGYILTQTDMKYALVNEQTGTIVQGIGEIGDNLVAADAYAIADAINPNWRADGLKLWLRVGGQSR